MHAAQAYEHKIKFRGKDAVLVRDCVLCYPTLRTLQLTCGSADATRVLTGESIIHTYELHNIPVQKNSSYVTTATTTPPM